MAENSETTGPLSYEAVRRETRPVFDKVLDWGLQNGFVFHQAARRVGLPTPGRKVMIEDKSQRETLLDFLIFEFRPHGRTLLAHCPREVLELTPIEAEFFDALHLTRTSLFEVTACLTTEHVIVLRDLLEPGQPDVRMTNAGFAEAFSNLLQPPLLFARVIAFRGFQFTSGVSLLFEANHLNKLLQPFQQKMKKVAPDDWNERKFIFFFERHRNFGLQIVYQDAR